MGREGARGEAVGRRARARMTIAFHSFFDSTRSGSSSHRRARVRASDDAPCPRRTARARDA